MQRTCLDIASISRYLNNLAEIEDVLRIERHVERCARCRDKLIRMKRYSEALFDDLVTPPPEDERACPSHIQLHHFLRGALSERQMVRVQEHFRACTRCSTRVRALMGTPPEAPNGLELFATRQPDLDLRAAPQGIRIASGGALLDDGNLPMLLLRLDLVELLRRSSAVTTARQLSFARPVGERVLRGRIELAGYEDFHLELQACDDPSIEALQLWTRERSIRRFAANQRFRELLGPGHYFVGPALFEEPWLAISLEQDFLTARGLAECGYDACCRGHFHSALRWFDDAMQLAPDVESYERMLDSVQEFARRFDLSERDRPIRWREPSVARARADAPAGVSPPMRSDVETIAHLVLQLQRKVEKSEHEPLAEAKLVSRREFRAAFQQLMQRLGDQLEQVHGTNATPGPPR